MLNALEVVLSLLPESESSEGIDYANYVHLALVTEVDPLP